MLPCHPHPPASHVKPPGLKEKATVVIGREGAPEEAPAAPVEEGRTPAGLHVYTHTPVLTVVDGKAHERKCV